MADYSRERLSAESHKRLLSVGHAARLPFDFCKQGFVA